jgi:hypothetical protein
MKCFYHNESDAVGVCRHCLKGICAECAVDFGDGLACKDHCESKAKATAQLVANTINAQKGLKTGRLLGPSFAMVLGLIFLGWALYCDNLVSFEGMAGLAFFTLGFLSLLYNFKYIKPINENNS